MHVTVIAVGTRGDAQPHVALGLGLREAGYTVRIATNGDYASMVRDRGLEYARVDFNPNVDFPQAKATLRDARLNVVQLARARGAVTQAIRPLSERLLTETWDACKGTDAIICTHLGVVGHVVAEKLGIPSLFSGLTPMSPTGAFPPYAFPNMPSRSRHANLFAYMVIRRTIWWLSRPIVNRWRARLSLAPLPARGPREALLGRRHSWLYGFSAAVVPKPPDWGAWRHVTGYWFLDRQDSWQPPSELQRFLDAGSPPVVISFGSTRTHDPEALANTAIDALALSGRRGILVTGWGGIQAAELPSTVLQVPSVPFDWLFPRAAVVVHHGGAGTTAAGLRAGVPTVTAPFFNEQRFWARRVHMIGAGPPPLRWRGLTPKRLAATIEGAMTDQSVRSRAASLGSAIRAEDGVARAVAAFEQIVNVTSGRRQD